MRYLIPLIFIFSVFSLAGQDFTPLEEFDSKGSIVNDKCIIYGNFIQRLGFSSGGFPQDIGIQNTETQDYFCFRVKPIYKSKKKNPFIFYIPPGKYRVIVYWWSKSQAYGAIHFTEPIYKNIDASTKEFIKKWKKGKINTKDYKNYEFTIEPNTINYLGTWHFNTGLISFTNDKQQFDKEIIGSYENIDFKKAITVLPK